MRNRTKTSYTILWVSLALCLGIVMGNAVSKKKDMGGSSAQRNSLYKLSSALKTMEDEYVDEIDYDSIVDRMLGTTLQSLDPHSRYLSVEELSKEDEYLHGQFDGVGVILYYIDDTACVEQVFENGPSNGKLQTGDRIVTIDGETVAGVGLTNTEVVGKIRGPKRSKVDLGVKRYGEEGLHHVVLTRNVINTYSISYSGMVDDHTGYVRLTKFIESSYREFYDAVSRLKRKGMTDLVLDLRSNGGGLLDQAINICDELLPGNELIVYTEGAHQSRQDVHSRPGGLFAKGNLVVLIDENSASASEIVSGAIQDNDRGIIVGRRSFGKGLVQRQFMLPDKSAMYLTVARYYTPSGRCIQRPYDKGTDEYYNDYLKQVMFDFTQDSMLTCVTDSTPYRTTKGRIVYGGGGIYPDYPLPYHTDLDIVYYNKLLEKGLTTRWAFDYVTREWGNLKKRYPKSEDFVKKYTVSEAMWQEFLRYAESKGVRRDARSLAKYGGMIRLRLKAELANCLYSTDTFYEIMLPEDEDISRALEIKKKHLNK